MTPQRLHPAVIVLRVGASIRQLAILILLFVVRAASGEETALIDFFPLVLIAGLVSFGAVVTWVRFQYWITDEHFVVTSGLLRQTRREIPLQRIQDLTFERSLLHRMLGLVAVSIQTAGTTGAEATLNTIREHDAEALRARLLGSGRTPSLEAAPLYKTRIRDLLLRGLTDNRAGLVLAGAAGVLNEALEVGGGESEAFVRGAFSAGQAGGWLVPLIAATIVGVWLVGYLASAGFNVLLFYGLELRENEGNFNRRFGLLTVRQHAIPRRRMQAAVVHQSAIRRAIGLASLQVQDMGQGAGAEEARRVGTDTFLPAGPVNELLKVARALMPGVPAKPARAISARHIRRTGARWSLLFVPAIGFAWTAMWWLALAPLVAGLLGLGAGWLRYRTLRYDMSESHLAVRDGILGRRWIFVPVKRVQAVTLKRTPFDLYHGVATFAVVTGGGFKVRIPDMPLADAERLRAELEARLPASAAKASLRSHSPFTEPVF